MVLEYKFNYNVAPDSCSFDTNDPKEQEACAKIFEWVNNGTVIFMIPHSVMKEIDHPHTPILKKQKAHELISTCDLGLTQEQSEKREALVKLIDENDSLHILIAQDYVDYFVTADNRYIVKEEEIRKILPGIKICKPSEFVRIVEDDKRQWEKSMEWKRRQGLV